YNSGPGSTPNYETNLASKAVYTLPEGITVFAGPRDDPFFVDLGSIFDRLELRPLGAFGDPKGRDSLAGYHYHCICLHTTISSLTADKRVASSPTSPSAVIGVWAAASRPSVTVLRNDGSAPNANGDYVQVSRLGNPLVNELFNPLANRDKWNAYTPSQE